MPTLHVVTVMPNLPLQLLDHVLTRVELALEDVGASRVWVADVRPGLAVMAELPDHATEPAGASS